MSVILLVQLKLKLNRYSLATHAIKLPISVCDWRQLLTNSEKVISDLGFTSGSVISKASNGFQKIETINFELDEFCFRWLENSVIGIGKTA